MSGAPSTNSESVSLVAYAKELRRLAQTPGTPEYAQVQAAKAAAENERGFQAAVARRYK